MDAFIALIDHKNIAASGKNPMDGIIAWLRNCVDTSQHSPVINVTLRSYGGWYDGTGYSEERAKALCYAQETFPSLFLIDNRPFRLNWHFAEALIAHTIEDKPQNRRVTFTHTSATRPSELVSVLRQATSCSIQTCRISEVRRWIFRKKACLAQGCPNSYSSFFERREQKQVDVHITCDLLLLSSKSCCVAVMSSDIDFVPAIVAFSQSSALGRVTWIRPNAELSYVDKDLEFLGVQVFPL